MKRLLMALGVAIVASAGLVAEEKGTIYGDGVKLTTSVKVADLLATPDQFLGRKVRVDGTIRAVCQSMGCWIQLADAEQSDGIQFKVDDGVIVFPKDAKGKRASAEGTFEKIAADAEHEAEHAADAQHAANQPPVSQPPKYRIKATGAVIY
jgi:hypothetical protein